MKSYFQNPEPAPPQKKTHNQLKESISFWEKIWSYEIKLQLCLEKLVRGTEKKYISNNPRNTIPKIKYGRSSTIWGSFSF